MGALVNTPSRAVDFERLLPRAAHSSARANFPFPSSSTRARRRSRPFRHGCAHRSPSHPAIQPRPPPTAANPSAASVGAGAAAAAAGAPPSVGLARSLFLPPRMTTPTSGVAPAPSRATAAPLEAKKRKISAKKKAADGSGTSKKKKLAGRRTAPASTEAPASSTVEPAADAHHVLDEMPPR